MLGFRKNHNHHRNRSTAESTYQYRVDSRHSLLERYKLVALRPDRDIDDERQRLARVLEEAAGDGWRLVGISGDDFVFRRRGNQPPR